MKAHLLFAGEDFDFAADPLPGEDDLVQDLELTTLLEAMAQGNRFLLGVARRVLLSGLEDPEAIEYRQHVLADCLEHPEVVRELYEIAAEAIAQEKRTYQPVFRHPTGTLSRSVEVLQGFLALLRRVRAIADERGPELVSEGFTRLFQMLRAELTDEYFRVVEGHLRRLRFRGGVHLSASLGPANKGTSYVLRAPSESHRPFRERVGLGERTSYSFTISERDEAGARALAELKDRGINLAANALAQSVDHVLGFFTMLCGELGFYLACCNLHQQLQEKGEPTCVPTPSPPGAPVLTFEGLYDVSLALRTEPRVVGNDVSADGKSLVVITGANSGGKSTFLRSAGIAQLMMQCGMFVGARSYRSSTCRGLFTHFRREEDAGMTMGKLEEELARMSAIADRLSPTSTVLFNESFSATNEREGSEIARQIVHALLDAGVRALFVTHLFDLAHGLHEELRADATFLRAERDEAGRRSFKLVEGEPLPTSYGEDLYRRLGGLPGRAAARR